jgi:hypothetical protein
MMKKEKEKTFQILKIALLLLPPAPPVAPAETKAWEVDTLRGHTNNVSCVMFHARQVRSCCSGLGSCC